MEGLVTCVWKNSTAQDLFERYKRHRREIQEMMAVSPDMQASADDGSAGEAVAKANALIQKIDSEMAGLVRDFAMPAVIMPKA